MILHKIGLGAAGNDLWGSAREPTVAGTLRRFADFNDCKTKLGGKIQPMTARNQNPQRILPLDRLAKPMPVPLGLWQNTDYERKEFSVLFTIAIILLVLWVLGFTVFHVAGALIHIVLVIAVISFVVGLLRRGTA